MFSMVAQNRACVGAGRNAGCPTQESQPAQRIAIPAYKTVQLYESKWFKRLPAELCQNGSFPFGRPLK